MKRAIRAADTAEDTRLDDAVSDLEDDFDYILSGLDKLGRSGATGINDGLVIAEKLQSTLQAVIKQIADKL